MTKSFSRTPSGDTLASRDIVTFDGRAERDASADLERDAIVYSHSENHVVMCAACWRDPEVDHSHEEKVEKRVVTGRIAAPPDLPPRDLLQQLDATMTKRAPCRLYVPALCDAAGFSDRAVFEQRRFDMIIRDPA